MVRSHSSFFLSEALDISDALHITCKYSIFVLALTGISYILLFMLGGSYTNDLSTLDECMHN